MKHCPVIWCLFTFLFIYNILDAHHTKIILLNIEEAYEANPVMRMAIERFGINVLFYVKVIAFVVLGLLLYSYEIERLPYESLNDTEWERL